MKNLALSEISKRLEFSTQGIPLDDKTAIEGITSQHEPNMNPTCGVTSYGLHGHLKISRFVGTFDIENDARATYPGTRIIPMYIPE